MVGESLRFTPEKRAVFEAHQAAWREGRFKLEDFCERGDDGEPLWYPDALNAKVRSSGMPIDKALLFDQVGYRPGLAACRFHASRARFKVFSGGARAGKSLAGAMEVAPLLLTPNMNIWLVGPEYDQCKKEFDYIADNTIHHPVLGPRYAPFLQRYQNSARTGEMEIKLKFGDVGESFVRVKSAGRETSLLSEELDCVMVCEASLIKERAWMRMLKMRLATRHGMAIFPSSPSGMGWVAKLYQRGMSGEREHFAVNADSRMNPTQDLDEIELLTFDMSDEDFNEQVEGRPVPRHGLVFHDFDYDLHCGTWRTEWPRPSWRKGRAIDFGHTDPAVILWIAEDEDHRYYVYREWYQRRRLPSDMVKEIARVEGWDTEISRQGKILLRGRPKSEVVDGYTVTDWDSGQRAELAFSGITCRMANKDISEGVSALARNFRRQRDGRPRLYIHPSCRELIRELQSYEWDGGGSDKPKKDQSDHAIDALRYYIRTMEPSGIALRAEAI